MKISQRTAKISLFINGILILMCLGLLIYALLQKTMADVLRIEAEKSREIAEQQLELAERQRDIADSAAKEANITLRQLDSLKKQKNTK